MRMFAPISVGFPPGTVDDRAGKRRVSKLLSLSVGGLFSSLLLLRFAAAPFFWIWLTWAVVFFSAIVCVGGEWTKAALLNFGVMACLLAAVEGYLVMHEYTPPVYPDGNPYIHDRVLGWAFRKDTEVHAIKLAPGTLFHQPRGLLFDAKYTIGPAGLRAAPTYQPDLLLGTVLFFGCSFTFGEGLRDSDTLPYQVGLQSQGRYRTINFGVNGYGPEQMLAEIEHGLVAQVVDTQPRYAYYEALTTHVSRVAGRVAWGGGAPRYILAGNGAVEQDGYLPNRESWADRLGLHHGVRQLNKSALWRMLDMRNSAVTEEDLRLYFAVVRRSKELLTTRYPGLQFRVILWPSKEEKATYEKMKQGFSELGIPVLLVEDALPDYQADPLKYSLSRRDRHPNGLANQLLARYLLNTINSLQTFHSAETRW